MPEDFVRGLRGSVMFRTHDRRFLRALATRIVEIDRGTSPVGSATTPTTCVGARSACTPKRRKRAFRDWVRLAQEEVDPPGHQGAAHARRRSRAPPEGSCVASVRSGANLPGTARMQLADAASRASAWSRRVTSVTLRDDAPVV